MALDEQGNVVATGRAYLKPDPSCEAVVYLECEVHPQHRKYGLREAAFSWAVMHGRQKLAELQVSGLPRLLRINCRDDLGERIGLYENYNFKPVRYFYKMQRNLDEPIPECKLEDGLVFCNYRPELNPALLLAFNEAFSDHWGFEPAAEEDLEVFFTSDTAFRPDLTYLVLEPVSGEIAGFSINFINPQENPQPGSEEGWIAEIGVRPRWRKRGIGSALLCQSMRAFLAAGAHFAGLSVDTENPTGALSIYSRLGFIPIKRNIAFEMPFEG